MKRFLSTFIAFAPSLAFSALVPLTEFDQSKLESVLRKMPSTHVQSEERGEFIRKHYLFQISGSQLKCSADYYGSSPVPSFKRCEVNLDESSIQKNGDEWQVEIKEPKTVTELYLALSFGLPEKKIYSTERVYGQAFEGEYRKLFRYSLNCSKQICRLTFAKP